MISELSVERQREHAQSQAKTLYKIDKLVSIWVSFKPELSILESAVRGALRYRKWQGCLGHVLTKFWNLEGQEDVKSPFSGTY